MDRKCIVCEQPIPRERLKALPETMTCVLHSMERPRTTADVEVDGPDAEDLRDSAMHPERGK